MIDNFCYTGDFYGSQNKNEVEIIQGEITSADKEVL